MAEDTSTRTILNKIRRIQDSEKRGATLRKLAESVSMLTEQNDKNAAIAITDDPKFGQSVLSNQIDQFRSAVDGGAKFMTANDTDVASSPLIYLPADNNLIFSGIIPSLGNLRFQFKLKSNTGYGAWIFIPDGMLLTDRTIETIGRLYQFYENWKEEWNCESVDLEKMAEHINS